MEDSEHVSSFNNPSLDLDRDLTAENITMPNPEANFDTWSFHSYPAPIFDSNLDYTHGNNFEDTINGVTVEGVSHFLDQEEGSSGGLQPFDQSVALHKEPEQLTETAVLLDKHATQVLGHEGSPDEDEAMPDDEDEEDHLFMPPEPHKHDLRPGFRDSGVACATWLDRDESGNYDPHSKTPKRARKKCKSTGDTETAEARRLGRTQRRLDEAASRINGQSYVITISLKSERGQALLAVGTNNWPDNEWNILADPVQPYGKDEDDVLDPALYTMQERNSRARREPACKKLAEREDLRGQPVARCCWSCHSLGLLGKGDRVDGCSLSYDTANWPCRSCAEDDLDCELITPPKVKKSCEDCKRRKINCSYTRTSDHTGPCLECQDAGIHCIAGPNKSMIPHRISLDYPTEPPERDVICTECLRLKKLCSLNTELQNNTGRNCRNCEKNGLSCIIADQETPRYPLLCDVKRRKAASSQKKRKAVEKGLEDNNEGQIMPRAKRAKPQEPCQQIIPTTNVIETKLCHPVEFNFNEPYDETTCDFCGTPTYPIVGLGPVNVTVVENSDAGYVELKNGHRAHGSAATKICPGCTLTFSRILLCQQHNIVEIDAAYLPTDYDFCAAFERLTTGQRAEKDYWCSFCPSPADSYCRKTPTVDCEGGCGLMLCILCAEQLKNEHLNDMGKFMESLTIHSTEERPMGLRADAELLKADGVLIKYLLTL